MNPTASILKSSRRESLFVAGMWILTCGYTVIYAGLNAYRPVEPVPLVFGMPAWVFWGVIAPWSVTTVVTLAYATWGIENSPLDEEPDGSGVME